MAKKAKIPPIKIDPNKSKAGAPYKLAFKTGPHKDKKKEANKKACRKKGDG